MEVLLTELLGRGGWEEEGRRWYLGPSSYGELSSACSIFFKPVTLEITNNCAFLLSELVSLMSTPLQKLLQC